MTRGILCTLLCICAASHAYAYILCQNQRLDHVLCSKHEQETVVAGTIEAVRMCEATDFMPERESEISFDVHSVILGDGVGKGENLRIPVKSFWWPGELVPCQKGMFCILILDPRDLGRADYQPPISVVPAHKRRFTRVADGEAAKRLLVHEILGELGDEQDENRQRLLILQASPILTANEAQSLTPFAESDNEWIRRAALAGLAWATKEQRYINLVIQDAQQYIKEHGSSRSVVGPDGKHGYAPLPLLLDHYFFLRLGWSREYDLKAMPYLRIYRYMATEYAAADLEQEWNIWHHGIKSLCRIGTKEDVPTLWHYLNSKREGQRKDVLSNSYNRQQLLMGISRILDLDLTNWEINEFEKREHIQFQVVEQALTDRGIID